MISMMTPFVIPGTYGAIGALAVTVTDRFRSQSDVVDENKSSFFTDLARNLAIGIITPIATLALLKTAVYLKVIPIAASAVTAFLGLSLALQIAIPVLVGAAIVLAIAIPVLLSRRAKAEVEVEGNLDAVLTGEVNGEKEKIDIKVNEKKVDAVVKENTKEKGIEKVEVQIISKDELDLESQSSEHEKETQVNLVGQGKNEKTANDDIKTAKDLSASTIVREQDTLDKELDEVIESLSK